jgi:predicted small secreted protein
VERNTSTASGKSNQQMKPTFIALLALCLCLAGCATLNDVGKHLWSTDSKEGQPTDKKVEPKEALEAVPDKLISDPIVEEAVRRRVSQSRVSAPTSLRRSLVRGVDVEVVRIRSGSGQMMSVPIASLPSYLSTKSAPEVAEIRKQLDIDITPRTLYRWLIFKNDFF